MSSPIQLPMSGVGFPIDRRKMYLFLFALNLCLRTFMFFIVSNQAVAYHVTVSVVSLIEIIVLWEFMLFMGSVLERKLPILYHNCKRIILQTLLTYGLSAVTGSLFFLIISQLFEVNYLPEMKAIVHLLYFMLVIVMNLVYFGIIYVFNWKNDLIKLANAQRAEALVKYDVLRNQINPHFLFNALTSVNSLIHEHPDLATDFLQQLSKVYRYVLQNKEKETVSVSTELTFVKNYTGLLKMKFAEAIEFSIDVDERAKEKKIVPVTLQILIENAIKHNIVSKAHPLKISITEKESFLRVQNNINRKSSVEASNQQGMGNLRSLYQYLTPTPIEIIERDEIYLVKIPLIDQDS
jgi:two-component system, LytTR family, sensor kinase